MEEDLGFTVAFRGYRRSEVDHYVARAEAVVADLAQQVDELQARVAELERALATRGSG